MKSRLRPALTLVLVLVGATARADSPPTAASTEQAPAVPIFSFQVRLQPPFLQLTLLGQQPEVLPTVGGASVAMEYRRRVVLELGSSRLPFVSSHNKEFGADVFLRGGYQWAWLDQTRTRPTGWVLLTPVLVGYRYLVSDIDNDGLHDGWPQSALQASSGLEVRRYVSRRVALSVRLLVGADLVLRPRLEPSNQTSSTPLSRLPTGPVEPSWAVDVGLDVGLVF